MKRFAIAAAALAALAVLAMPVHAQAQSSSVPYGQPTGTQLSTCMRNGLIGAGVGAVAGAVTGGEHKLNRALLGAVVGGAGTYLVCKYLTNRDQSRVENGYVRALTTNNPYSTRFTNQALGGASLLNVAAPVPVAGQDNCRDVSASLTTPGMGLLPLPQERYCQGANGKWAPTPFN